MFEYTALVDAPVQRFTGIVAGPDPIEDGVSPTPASLRAPDDARPPAPRGARPPILAVRAAAQPVRLGTPPAAVTGSGRPVRPTGPTAAEDRGGSSLIPAVLALAAAGATAMWWLRRRD